MTHLSARLKLVFSTRQLRKESLVLVNSFGTNSKILKPLISYLDDFFTVHFVDLPGFIQEISPLQQITIDGYVSFVEQKIKGARFALFYFWWYFFWFFYCHAT